VGLESVENLRGVKIVFAGIELSELRSDFQFVAIQILLWVVRRVYVLRGVLKEGERF
jgi:hypothetical protein